MIFKVIHCIKKLLLVNWTVIFISGCMEAQETGPETIQKENETIITAKKGNSSQQAFDTLKRGQIETGKTNPAELLAFAKTLVGVPYLYASTDPAKGFDCSGFITYVFNHFNINVPRSSVDFTNYGREIHFGKAKPGDLILFTGTDSTVRIVGHMGIVESIQNDTLHFIHSTSGKMKGVVITPFGNYYRSRFVKVIRVFAEEYFQ